MRGYNTAQRRRDLEGQTRRRTAQHSTASAPFEMIRRSQKPAPVRLSCHLLPFFTTLLTLAPVFCQQTGGLRSLKQKLAGLQRRGRSGSLRDGRVWNGNSVNLPRIFPTADQLRALLTDSRASASPSPTQSPPSGSTSSSSGSSDSNTITIILLLVALGLSLLIAVAAIVIACILWRHLPPYIKSQGLQALAISTPPSFDLEAGTEEEYRQRHLPAQDQAQNGGSPEQWGGSSNGESNGTSGSSFDIQRVIQFRLKDLAEASDNFSSANHLGQGSYGMVYKGKVKAGELVAVKRAKADRRQNNEKFRKEVELLSRVSHKHLVRLVGYCQESGEQLLVYEYIAGGNLSQNLNRQWRAKQSRPPLNWTERLIVAAGIARALSYLHEEINIPFIHRDVKASNILIDRHVVAKLADFGTTKPMTPEELRKMSANIQGTAGYCDPDYLRSGQPSKRIDVYSFGIVLLELITGVGPHKIVKPYRYYVKEKLERHGLNAIVDESMGLYPEEEVQQILDLAFSCTDLADPSSRPSMGRVVSEIEAVLEPERRLKSSVHPRPPRLISHSHPRSVSNTPPVAENREEGHPANTSEASQEGSQGSGPTARSIVPSNASGFRSPLGTPAGSQLSATPDWSQENQLVLSGVPGEAQGTQSDSFDRSGVHSFGGIEPG